MNNKNMFKFPMIEVYIPSTENLYYDNPVQPGNVLDYGKNPLFELYGYHYDREMFYLIDFYGIKKNKYYISSYGRIFSNTRNREMHSNGNNHGYKTIFLQMENGRKNFSLHRLVAMAFIPKELDDLINYRDMVNHKDLCKDDNYYKNLEWCNSKENINHGFDNNTTTLIPVMTYQNKQNNWNNPTFGDRHGMSTISDEQVHIICKAISEGKSYKECCILANIEYNDSIVKLLVNIKAGRRRQKIASQYGISPENKLTKDQIDKTKFIIPVCELLEQGYNIKSICEILQIDPESYDRARGFVGNIKNRKTYTSISKDYNF